MARLGLGLDPPAFSWSRQQRSSIKHRPATLPTDSTVVFIWRNSQIAMKQASYIDDRRWVTLTVHCFNCSALMGTSLCMPPAIPNYISRSCSVLLLPTLPPHCPITQGPAAAGRHGSVFVDGHLPGVMRRPGRNLSLVPWAVSLEPKIRPRAGMGAGQPIQLHAGLTASVSGQQHLSCFQVLSSISVCSGMLTRHRAMRGAAPATAWTAARGVAWPAWPTTAAA